MRQERRCSTVINLCELVFQWSYFSLQTQCLFKC